MFQLVFSFTINKMHSSAQPNHHPFNRNERTVPGAPRFNQSVIPAMNESEHEDEIESLTIASLCDSLISSALKHGASFRAFPIKDRIEIK